MGSDNAHRIVLAPDVIAKSFLILEYRELLERWRDGIVQVVLTRELLVRYLQVLRRIGIPDRQLRPWAAWFTAQEKALFLPKPGCSSKNVLDILRDAAQRGNAACIVSSVSPESLETETIHWMSVADFLNE